MARIVCCGSILVLFTVIAGAAEEPSENPAGPAQATPPKQVDPYEETVPQEIPMPPWMERLGMDMGGWVEIGYTMNAHGRGDGFNGPVLLNNPADEFELNQLWYYLERPVDTSEKGWDIGGRIDMVYGADSHYVQSPGLEEKINSFYSPMALALPQFYFKAGVGDLTVKMGRFGHVMAYETAFPIYDFFYSNSYALNSVEPWIMVGMLGEYQMTDNLKLECGFHRGGNMFEDVNNHLDLVTGVAWESDSGDTLLSWRTNIGPRDVAGEQFRMVYGLVAQHQWTEKLKAVSVQYFGYEEGAGVGGADATWIGVSQYFFYDINDKWSVGMRADMLHDNGGGALTGLGVVCPGRGWGGGPGFDGDFTDLTFGFHYVPHANVTVRPEIRWDWYNGHRDPDGELPFDGGDSAHQLLLAVDMIITF